MRGVDIADAPLRVRGVDNADEPLRVRGVDVADAPLRERSVDVAVALLRVIRDAATSGKAEISESDVPQACAATPSQSRRNDMDQEEGCRDSASETDAATPLVEGTEVQEQPRRRIHHEVLNLSVGRNGLNKDPKSQNTKEPVTMQRKKEPSGSAGPAMSYTVHTKMHQQVLDQSEGLTRDGWRKK